MSCHRICRDALAVERRPCRDRLSPVRQAALLSRILRAWMVSIMARFRRRMTEHARSCRCSLVGPRRARWLAVTLPPLAVTQKPSRQDARGGPQGVGTMRLYLVQHGESRRRTGMSPPIFERGRAVIAILLLLLGCAAAEEIPQSRWVPAAPMPTSRSELAAAAATAEAALDLDRPETVERMDRADRALFDARPADPASLAAQLRWLIARRDGDAAAGFPGRVERPGRDGAHRRPARGGARESPDRRGSIMGPVRKAGPPFLRP